MSPRKMWFIRKVARFAIIAFLVLTITFILPRMMPGDPIENLFGETVTRVDPDVRAFLEEKYELDRPLADQYVKYLSTVFSFDFGYSITLGMEINGLIAQRMMWTIALLLPAILIGSTVSFLLATRCGMRGSGPLDRAMSFTAIIVHTVPGFLVAMLFVRFFSFQLDWFPLGQLRSGNYQGLLDLGDIAYHLFLPITVVALLVGSSQFLVLRNSVTQIGDEYFIFVARSKGLRERTVATRHVMRNVLPTFLSMLALNIGFIVSGTLLIEIVFSIQGMGSLLYDAVRLQDYPLMQAVFIILTFSVLIMNLVAELLYGWADPRVGDSQVKG